MSIAEKFGKTREEHHVSRGIEDYALIGDCETAAPIGRGGSIDWLGA